jgi:general L-amino acid transport system permease protein
MTVWVRRHLLRTPFDAALSLLGGAVAGYTLYRALRFVFVTGQWEVVRVNLPLFLAGSWPREELWRLVVAIVAAAAVWGLVAGYLRARRRDALALEAVPAEQRPGGELAPAGEAVPVRAGRRLVDLAGRTWPVAVLVILLLLLAATPGPWLLAGGALVAAVVGSLIGARLPERTGAVLVAAVVAVAAGSLWLLASGVGWDSWGGAMINLVLAAVSILLSFPLGVLLALGRRSSLPVIRMLSTVYIEVFRGVPLIALLLMASVALGFFIPISLAPGPVVRAVVVFVLFTAAYVAEIVRGGLQSVPVGQVEAGRANGLSPLAVTRWIVLPQAIRNVIPALVGQFISLFKDTTLAGAAMGITDLLTAAEASTAQTRFRGQGLIAETLVFVLALFWAGSYTMSNESQRLEARLGVGRR